MNQKRKAFILTELIPFILREGGRGFAMSTWLRKLPPGALWSGDGISRLVPPCGTLGCIGGSVEFLRHVHTPRGQAAALGLTRAQAKTLFWHWQPYDKSGWPKRYRVRYARAHTTLGKAKVACDLLRAVVRTEGKCLSGGGK